MSSAPLSTLRLKVMAHRRFTWTPPRSWLGVRPGASGSEVDHGGDGVFRWVLGGLLLAVLALGGLVAAPSVHAQTPPRPVVNGIPTSICQQSAIDRCDADCADFGPCKFGCQIGGINNADACTSSCNVLGAPCLNACSQVIASIALCAFPTVGGTVSGLGGGQSVVLQNNGGDDLTVSANGAFTFPMWVTLNDAYSVTVSGQPAGQACSVTNGSGVADSAAVVVTPYGVRNISVTCATAVPTMSQWGIVLLLGILAIGGLVLLSPVFGRGARPQT